MFPKNVPKMFYDEIIDGFDGLIGKFQRDSAQVKQRLEDLANPNVFLPPVKGQNPIVTKIVTEKNLGDASAEFDLRIEDMERRRAIHINHSKCFPIDALLQDSFLNMPYNTKQNWEMFRLPFPFTFFELEEPVELKVSELVGYDIEVKGITLARYSTIENTGAKVKQYGEGESDSRDSFEITLHHSDPRSGFDSLSFDIHTLPQFVFAGQRKFLIIDPEQEETKIVDITGEEGVDIRPLSKRIYAPPPEDLIKDYDYEHTSLSQMITFCVNAINFINAKNTYYKKVPRVSTKEERRLKKINQKKVAKGKVPFIPVRPYYLLEVEKKVYIDDEEREGDKSWELNHRVWVRGHHRHYQDGTILRIEPHVRGPPEAPWKHNRYAVLYKKFRKILKNPKYK